MSSHSHCEKISRFNKRVAVSQRYAGLPVIKPCLNQQFITTTHSTDSKTNQLYIIVFPCLFRPET